MRKLRMALVLVAVCLMFGVCAQAKSVTLVHSFKAGQIDKYKMSMDMRMAMPGIPQFAGKPFNVKMTSTFRQKVLGILPDGSAKVLVSYGDVNVSSPQFRGMPMQKVQPGSITLTLARDGSLVAMESAGVPQMWAGLPGFDPSQLGGQMGYVGVFPSGPIEVGQSWSKDIPMPFNSGTINIVSTLLGASVPVGKDVACKIKQTYQAYMDLGAFVNALAALGKASSRNVSLNGGMTITGWTVFYFSPDRGKLLKANGQAKADLTVDVPAEVVSMGVPRSMTMNMNMNINIVRV